MTTKNKTRRFRVAVAITATLSLGGWIAAEQLVVQAEKVVVREKKGSMYKPLQTFTKGQSIDVVERDGDWLKVKTEAGDGWIFASALNPRKGSSLDPAGAAINVAGGDARATEVQTGAAAKGLDSFKYAKSKNYKTDALVALEKMRQKVTYEDWAKFAADGKVGVR